MMAAFVMVVLVALTPIAVSAQTQPSSVACYWVTNERRILDSMLRVFPHVEAQPGFPQGQKIAYRYWVYEYARERWFPLVWNVQWRPGIVSQDEITVGYGKHHLGTEIWWHDGTRWYGQTFLHTTSYVQHALLLAGAASGEHVDNESASCTTQ